MRLYDTDGTNIIDTSKTNINKLEEVDRLGAVTCRMSFSSDTFIWQWRCISYVPQFLIYIVLVDLFGGT